MEVAPVTAGCESEIRRNESLCAGELSGAAVDAPARRPGERAGFKISSEVAAAGGRKPQHMARALSERNLTSLFKFVRTGWPQLRFEKRELAR